MINESGARNNTVEEQLSLLGACPAARLWVRSNQYETMKEAWDACHQFSWMVWLLVRLHTLSKPQLILLLCAIFRVSLRYIPQEESRPRTLIENLEYLARNEIPFETAKAALEDCDIAVSELPNNFTDAVRMICSTQHLGRLILDSGLLISSPCSLPNSISTTVAEVADTVYEGEKQNDQHRVTLADMIREAWPDPFKIPTTIDPEKLAEKYFPEPREGGVTNA